LGAANCVKNFSIAAKRHLRNDSPDIAPTMAAVAKLSASGQSARVAELLGPLVECRLIQGGGEIRVLLGRDIRKRQGAARGLVFHGGMQVGL